VDQPLGGSLPGPAPRPVGPYRRLEAAAPHGPGARLERFAGAPGA
jgi:hypothetical protein